MREKIRKKCADLAGFGQPTFGHTKHTSGNGWQSQFNQCSISLIMSLENLAERLNLLMNKYLFLHLIIRFAQPLNQL
jgi:hypothetical protein